MSNREHSDGRVGPCPFGEARLERYLDDELPEVEIEAWQRHLQACEACADELAREGRLRASLAALPAVALPAAARRRILDAVSRGGTGDGPEVRRRSPGRRRPASRRLLRLPQLSPGTRTSRPARTLAGVLAAAALVAGIALLWPLVETDGRSGGQAGGQSGRQSGGLAQGGVPAPQELVAASGYSEREIQTAKVQATWSLALALQLVDVSQRAALGEVFGRQLPGTLRSSMLRSFEVLEGGRG
jgi:anti-sigma factor RsiW